MITEWTTEIDLLGKVLSSTQSYDKPDVIRVIV